LEWVAQRRVAAGINPAAKATRKHDTTGDYPYPSVEPPVAGPRLDVKTPVFEGPLELLLALAEREEVDLFQVSLARVTDGYLAEIAAREVADPQEMVEFLWMAARLLLLKSIRLLPGEPPTEEQTPGGVPGLQADGRRSHGACGPREVLVSTPRASS
jgi:hypothetical protein